MEFSFQQSRLILKVRKSSKRLETQRARTTVQKMLDVPSLNTQQRTIFNEFRRAVSDILLPCYDNDDFVLKWLVAREFDIPKAELMIRESLKLAYNLNYPDVWKEDFKLHPIVDQYIPSKFWGFDEEGSPVRGGTFKVDWKGVFKSITMAELMRAFGHIIESDVTRAKEYGAKTGKRNLQTVLVLDFKDVEFRQLLNKEVLNKGLYLIALYQNNFPEHLKYAYIINVPSFFHKAYALAKAFIDHKTQKKLRIFSDGWKEELLQVLDPKIVPTYYGGENSDPAIDPSKLFASSLDIPFEDYLKDPLFVKSADPKTIHIFVDERATFHHRINVMKPGTVVRWIFQTKDYNIKFGTFIETPEGQSMNSSKRDVDAELLDSHIIPQRGELHCEKSCVCVLVFDNSHSWVTKKHVLLQIDIQEPIL